MDDGGRLLPTDRIAALALAGFDADSAAPGATGQAAAAEEDPFAADSESQALISELKKNAVKFSEKDILFITRDKTGQIVWLETGREDVGFTHIKNGHEQDFQRKHNVQPSDLLDHLKNVCTYGQVERNDIVYRKGRPGFERIYNYAGKYYACTGVGLNGFIVSCYPVTPEKKK